MEDRQFQLAIREYRGIIIGVGPTTIGMDWVSDLYVQGTRYCVELADQYLPREANVLDLGCGMGLVAILLGMMGHHVTGLDIDIGNRPEMLAEALKAPWGSMVVEIENPRCITDCWSQLSRRFGNEFLPFDGKRIPFENGSLDGVLEHAVYEHIQHEQLPEMLDDVNRVLKSNGLYFILRTPRKSSYLKTLSNKLGLSTHELIYDESEVEALVSKHGFRLVRSDVTDMLPSFPPFCLSFYNFISPCLIRLDRFLLKTWLRKYANHMALIFRKVQ